MESFNEKPRKQAQKKKKHDFGGEQYWIIPTKGDNRKNCIKPGGSSSRKV